MLEPFEQAAGKVAFSAPRLRLVSNLTGQVASAAQIAQPAYWRRHIREPVQYAASMQTLADAGCTVFLEIGPNPVLLGLGRGCVEPERSALAGVAAVRTRRLGRVAGQPESNFTCTVWMSIGRDSIVIIRDAKSVCPPILSSGSDISSIEKPGAAGRSAKTAYHSSFGRAIHRLADP